jgi:hypothetical protein
MRTALVLFVIVITASAARADDVDSLRKKYLSDPTTGAEIKHAIDQRMVIVGMCPFQAFAAAGEPGFYKVVADKRWPGNIAPPVIVNAQCEHPDDSVIELTFRSSTQFHTKEPVPFFVKFEHGRAVSIERPLPPTIARPPNQAILAQQTPRAHASREEALAFLREKYIYLRGMQVVSTTWDEKERVWVIALSFHGISTDTWTVDADAKKFWFLSHR